MSTNSRFAVAVHVLTLLAQAGEDPAPVTSEYIAASVNTNPVVIRRALGGLREARLVSSQGGNGGGWHLLRAPNAITLCDVYRAVEDEPPFALHHRTPNPNCPVGHNIQRALNTRFATAAQALEDELARTTIADVLQDVLSGVGSHSNRENEEG
jgi:Rrf2 family protein